MAETMTPVAAWIRDERSTAADRCIYCGLGFSGSSPDGVVTRWWDNHGRGPLHAQCGQELMRPPDKRMQFSVQRAKDE